ncbi:putative nucleotidyltransferase [Bacillus mesophilus]|uniref:Nucleotidyltransferase domain-containing protein n=1 Tax=Bacillus mesophilus TaxID=1808955 RepID=A0A6M0QAF7_9BACI|nr:nucleotidyltransferase domain-containing protein [Bacillus mesophilus]MBM7661901.1 putative nucleotidyltransferase [Bacillus mesophilus]NEY72739.1 nucleotidyltransferase domain-containing protein [Bacillus mesophilus]
MSKEISARLKTIEDEYGVSVIFACEAGSRIWGTDHHDSDYDVRFIYIYPLEKYLELDAPKDSIEDKKGFNIECAGWELGKALRLLRKQNPSIIEWLHSPITYVNRFNLKAQLTSLHQSFYDKKPLLHHYLNMAKTNQSLLNKQKTNLKLSLNIIRPLLVCNWMMNNDRFPPLKLEELLYMPMSTEIRDAISELLSIKRSGQDNIEQLHPLIDQWIQLQTEMLSHQLTTTNQTITFSSKEFTAELNRLYQSVIKNTSA